jgi:hypothetical protein
MTMGAEPGQGSPDGHCSSSVRCCYLHAGARTESSSARASILENRSPSWLRSPIQSFLNISEESSGPKVPYWTSSVAVSRIPSAQVLTAPNPSSLWVCRSVCRAPTSSLTTGFPFAASGASGEKRLRCGGRKISDISMGVSVRDHPALKERPFISRCLKRLRAVTSAARGLSYSD